MTASRRALLATGLAGLVAATTPLSTFADDWYNERQKVEWDLGISPMPPVERALPNEKKYAKLQPHAPVDLDKDDSGLVSRLGAHFVEKGAIQKGFEVQDKMGLEVTKFTYGAALVDPAALELHCRESVGFLYSRIRNLPKHNLKWTPVVPGTDYSGKYNERAFIGHGRPVVHTIDAIAKDGRKFSHLDAIYDPKSAFVPVEISEKKVDSWYVFFSPESFEAAIRETIQITTAARALEHSKGIWWTVIAQPADSTATALAYLVAYDLADQKGFHTYRQAAKWKINQRASEFSTDSMAPWIILWAKRQGPNGAEKVLEAYFDNPEEFLQKVADETYGKKAP